MGFDLSRVKTVALVGRAYCIQENAGIRRAVSRMGVLCRPAGPDVKNSTRQFRFVGVNQLHRGRVDLEDRSPVRDEYEFVVQRAHHTYSALVLIDSGWALLPSVSCQIGSFLTSLKRETVRLLPRLIVDPREP